MTNSRKRRLLVGFVLIVLIVVGGPVLVLSFWLDPGDKHDTTSDLVTPTITTQHVRVFEVLVDESQVDFVTEVRGIKIQGTYPVEGGTISLEPIGDALRVHVYLEINVDEVDIAEIAKPFLRRAMETGDYPLAFYVATSRDLVPVTEDIIHFALDGDLEVHDVAQPHSMDIEAQLVGGDMWAIATSDLDLGQHAIEFPAIFGSSTIQLTARLFMREIENPNGIPTQVSP
jgi:hypothetical protein